MKRLILNSLIRYSTMACAMMGALLVLFIGCAAANEFSPVPAGDALYEHLTVVRRAGWSSLARPSAPAESGVLTRYEMALETARAIIAVRARARADAQWSKAFSSQSLNSLRALSIALQSELARFDVDTKDVLALLDSAAQPPDKQPSIAPAIKTASPTGDDTSPSSDFQQPSGLPLSQRLRVYAALSSLASEADDPFGSDVFGASQSPSLHLSQPSRNLSWRTGAALDVTNWLRVRGGFAGQTNRPSNRGANGAVDATGLNALLSPSANTHASTPARPGGAEERSFGGGVDIRVRPNFILSGDVARVQSENMALGQWSRFRGTKIEGSVGLNGWQNRVALSAHLARLLPEDSLALASTAAQLNLGVGLTQQVSLNLLYQQLFDASPQTRGNRVIAGGLTVDF